MDLKDVASDVVQRALRGGATAAEAVVREGSEFSTVVRLGNVETLKESGAKAIGVRVFFGHRAASTYTSDFSPAALQRMVDSALSAGARHQRRSLCRHPQPGRTRQP